MEKALQKKAVQNSNVKHGDAGRSYTEHSHTRKKGAQKQEERISAGVTCPVTDKCGGCRGFQESYEKQLQKKETFLKDCCGSFGKFDSIIGMENPYHYRNKVHAVFGEDRRHNIISGTYEEKSHRIVPVDACLLDDEKADAIIVSIRKLLKSFKIRPYNEDTGYGLFRHVLIRTGRYTGQIMVVLVLASPVMPSKNNFVKALLKEHPEITTIVLNVNGRGTSMVLGEKEHVLYGKGYIEDVLCGKCFRISSKSFYQVNPIQTEKLYGKAVEFAALTGKEVVLDAYCGTGTIGLIASDKAGEVIGVELNAAAVKDAKINAKANRVKNITFYEKDAGQFMVQLAGQHTKVDVVLMDPPRAGSDEAFLSSLVKLAPNRVVYVSCNPETLARDLRYLTKKGYRMIKGVGVDMFPWTNHVECAVLLQK
ncbi:MAG: 23S rRNA (uracil(1939)-C(5))-methyltransferase RlmD [Lachnospiraceae bacterium]|nr:23S rRNA (uracil(1939)-C(5))-methyltransferase RlmD [Lachnospiraceae bacterium]